MSVYELTAREIHDTYFPQMDPAKLINMGRTNIATRLMQEDDFDEEDAFYAADEVLTFAQEQIAGSPPQ